jgi:hypothetical protein
MKQSFARQHSHHRDRTPSVICLPPPRPPVAMTRPAEPEVEPEAAIAMPDHPEPLVAERAEVTAPAAPLNRQARRKAQRAEAKALRRQGHAPAPARPATAPAQPTLELGPEAAVEERPAVEPILAATVAERDAGTPLPPARALVAARPRGLALLAHRLRGMLGLRRGCALPATGEGAIASQLRSLRAELAALQKSVDRMIDGVAA